MDGNPSIWREKKVDYVPRKKKEKKSRRFGNHTHWQTASLSKERWPAPGSSHTRHMPLFEGRIPAGRTDVMKQRGSKHSDTFKLAPCRTICTFTSSVAISGATTPAMSCHLFFESFEPAWEALLTFETFTGTQIFRWWMKEVVLVPSPQTSLASGRSRKFKRGSGTQPVSVIQVWFVHSDKQIFQI